MKKYLLVVQRNKASLGARFANNFIDSFILWVINLILSIISTIIYQITEIHFFYFYSSGGFIWNFFVGSIVAMIYYFLLENYLDGRTIGKLVTGTRVISTDGTKPSTQQIINRCLYRIIPFEALTFFGTDGWHDSLTDTRVINYKNYLAETQTKADIDDIGKREIA